MPIKGVTDHTRLPRLGKIHLGVKVPAAGGKAEYPRAVDYFVCPDPVKRVYGEHPKSLEIVFPSEETDVWASQFYKCYSKTRLLCKGDGQTAWSLVDVKTGQLASRESTEVVMKEVRCDADLCPIYMAGNCRPIMCLQFMLPAVEGLGIWQIDTGSWNSIRNINDGIAFIRSLAGRVSLIPLKLEIGPKEVTVARENGVTRKQIYCMTLNTNLKLSDIVRLRATPLLPTGRVLPATPADDEVPEDLFTEELLEQMEEGGKGLQAPKGTPPPLPPKKVAGKRGRAEEARAAHNREAAGSNPAPATTTEKPPILDPSEPREPEKVIGVTDWRTLLGFPGSS